MSWATSNLGDGNVGVAFAHGDTVVSCCYGKVRDIHILRAANVEAISIGAICRGCYGEVRHGDVGTPGDLAVEAFTVKQVDILDNTILYFQHLKRLHDSCSKRIKNI